MIPISFSKSILSRLKKELSKAYELKNVDSYRIIQALIWYGEGQAVEEIAIFLQVTAKTIYNWIQDFICKGFSWLFMKRYQGRGVESKLNPWQKEKLYEWVVAGPEAMGFNCGIWNSALIMELIFVKFGVKYHPHSIPKLLKSLGLSYQKAKFVSDRLDEEEHQKKRQIWLNETWPEILEKAKKNNDVILFGDEVSFAMWGSLGRTWAPRGQQPEIKTKGVRKGLKMYGAIEFESGDFQYKESFHYKLAAKSFKQLKTEGLPAELIAQLKPLKNEEYKTEKEFLATAEGLIGKEQCESYKKILLKHTQITGKFNAEGYIEFLKQLLSHFKTRIILIEDGAPYHKAKKVLAFIEEQPRLTVYRLPSFSPDYNPIEKLWKNTKRDATHLKYFQTFEKLRESVVQAFEKYLNDASKVICVMKKLRMDAGLADIKGILQGK